MRKLFVSIVLMLAAASASAACSVPCVPVKNEDQIAKFVAMFPQERQARKYVADAAKAKDFCGLIKREDKDFAECVNAIFPILQDQE